MNYIAQLNGFFDLKQRNPLSSNAQTLYINLFYIDNRCGWKPRFTVSNVTLQSLTGLSRQQLDRARNELVQKGYVEYKKGAGNQAGMYLLVCFDTQTDTQTDTQIDTQTDTQSGHKLRTLNKLKQKTKTKENPPSSPPGGKAAPFDDEAVKDLFNKLCSKLPKAERITDQRHRAIAGLVKNGATLETFRAVFQAVENSDFLTGKDGKWHGCCFDWILRPANFQKIKEGNYANPKKKGPWDGAIIDGGYDNPALNYAQRGREAYDGLDYLVQY